MRTPTTDIVSASPTAGAAAADAPALLAGDGQPATAPQLRAAFGRFTTGVTLITCRDAEGRPVGLTANSFSSLSLDPPLVLWSLRQASTQIAAFAAAPAFAVNVLAEGQVDLSRRFASRDVPDKFAEGAWADGWGGVPVLAGCAAVFECDTVSQQTAGDHVLFIGRVRRLAYTGGVPPLVFHAGHYHLLGEVL